MVTATGVAAEVRWSLVLAVVPGLAPGIHVWLFAVHEDVDGRDKPGHDE